MRAAPHGRDVCSSFAVHFRSSFVSCRADMMDRRVRVPTDFRKRRRSSTLRLDRRAFLFFEQEQFTYSGESLWLVSSPLSWKVGRAERSAVPALSEHCSVHRNAGSASLRSWIHLWKCCSQELWVCFCVFFGLRVAETRGKRSCHTGQRCCQFLTVRIVANIEREARVQTSIRRSSGTEQNSVGQMPQ